MKSLSRLTLIGGACLTLAAFTALPLPSTSVAWAQAAGMGGVGASDTVTVRARVKAVNQTTRKVTLVGPEGNVFTVVAGPEVRNLAQVRPGNTVVVRYHAAAVFVLSPPGTPIPQDTLTVGGAQAAPGQMPAGGAASRIVVTGLVVGVDPVHHTISLVDPKGGAVRVLDVTDPALQARLGRVNVGDSIMAVITEAVAVAVEPTR